MSEETFLKALRVRGIVISGLHPIAGGSNPGLLLFSSVKF